MVFPSGSGAPPASNRSSEPEDADSWVWLARLRRPQGRKGEILAEILTDFPEKFTERRHLWLLPAPSAAKTTSSAQPRPVDLVHHWLHKGGIVFHFAGVNSISAAEELSGLLVAIPRAGRAPLDEDAAYIGDLIGAELIDLAGPAPISIGAIRDVDRTAGPVALLVVQGPHGEVLIPFAKSYLRRLDLPNRRIEMSLPEGLTSLNQE